MYIPTVVIIGMVCGGIGGALGFYLTKKKTKKIKKTINRLLLLIYYIPQAAKPCALYARVAALIWS